jgi:hypothetical protein
VNERVYAVGGWDGKEDSPAVESFSPSMQGGGPGGGAGAVGVGGWRREAALNVPRSNLAVAVLWR